MARELMWICAIAPETFRKRVTQFCLAENRTVGLPENVFKLPLHISMKKSFYTDSFDAVKENLVSILNRTGRFCCRIDKVEFHRNMLWLSLINDGDLRRLHEELDCLLAERYDIPISKYDWQFQPHISLFTINRMPIASSSYWNIVHGNTPDEVRQDLEGMQIMRNLGRSLGFMVKAYAMAKAEGIEQTHETGARTNFIR